MIYTLFNKFKFTLIKVSTILILFVFFILSFHSIKQIHSIKTEYSASQFLPKNHPLLDQEHEIYKKYKLANQSPHIMLLRLPKKMNWLHIDQFSKLKKLTSAIEESQKVERVVSLSNIGIAAFESDSFYTGKVEEIITDKTQRNRLLKNPLIVPHLLKANARDTIIIAFPSVMNNASHESLMNQMRTVAQLYAPDAKAYLGGPAAIRTEVSNLLSKELAIFVVLALLGSLLVLFFVFEGWMAAPIMFIVVMGANLVSLATMGIMGISFTILSATIPILVTITASAITIHTLMRLNEEFAKMNTANKSKKEIQNLKIDLILHILKELWIPHLLTAATTIIGFGTLALSNVPLIKDFGITVSLVIPVATISTLLVLPCLLLWFPLPTSRQWLNQRNHFADFVIRYRLPLFLAIIGGFVVTGIKGMDIKWTGRMFDDLPKNHESRLATQYIGNQLGGIIPLEINIQSNKRMSTWSNPQAIKKLDRLINKFKQSQVVAGSMSIVDFFKVADPKFRLPHHKTQLSEIFLVYGMSSENPLNSFITPNHDGTRILLKLRDAPADRILKLKSEITELFETDFPEHSITFGGIGATLHPLNNDLSKNLMLGFFQALFGIVVLLAFVFKSLRWALVSVIPNMIPPVALMGALAITQTPIKPGIAIIFAISLGIAFDNTIYILGRLKKMIEEKKYDQLPIEELLRHEFSACFISGLSLLCGFSIFLFSYFKVNQIFGAFMLLSVVAGLIGDLVLLPIVLKMFPRLLIGNNSDKIESSSLNNKGNSMVQVASAMILFFVLALLTGSSESNASENANTILNKLRSMATPKDETSVLQMTITEPDGSKKNRSLTIMRKNSDSQKALVKIESPSDLKGVALLSITEGDKEDQWLYLPSTKKARRIVGSGKSGKFLDSELSYEDLSPSTYSLFTNQVLPKTKNKKEPLSIIESLAKPNTETSFKKIKTYVNTKLNRIEKVEYFDKQNKLIKTMSFSKYKKLENKYWRAGLIKIQNHQLKRGTLLELKSVNLKKLDDDQFTTAALE